LATPRPRVRPGVHAFDLGVVIEQRNAAASDRGAIEPRQEEAHVGLEQLRDCQAVALMRLVGGVEHRIEFTDEGAQFRCRCTDPFYRDGHGNSGSAILRPYYVEQFVQQIQPSS
jgi:hypothetical protein